MESLVDGVDAALGEDLLAEEFGDGGQVVVVLGEHAVVDLEAGKAHVKKLSQVGAHIGVRHLHDLLVVGELGRDNLTDADRVGQGRGGSLSGGRSDDFDYGLFVSRVASFVTELLVDVEGRVLVGNDGLGCLSEDLDRFRDHDVNPDLVAKAVVLTSLHAEVRAVATRINRSHKVRSHYEVLTRSDRTNSSGLELQFITVGLNKLGINRPLSFAIVAHGPLLLEPTTGGERGPVTETFLDKASRVLDEFLRLLGLGAEPACHGLSLGDRRIEVFAELLAKDFGYGGKFFLALGHQVIDVVLVLADDAVGGVVRFSDLEHGVLLVDAFFLAFAAQIVIVAHTTLIPNPDNRRSITPVTLILRVFDFSLLFRPLLYVALHEAGEALLNQSAHFFLDHGDEGEEFFGLDETGAFALFAGAAFFVEHVAVALPTGNVLGGDVFF